MPVLLGCAAFLWSSTVAAQENAVQTKAVQTNTDSDGAPADPFQKDATDVAVERAVAYLLTQQRDDGAIVENQHDTTMTALAVMAMASVGVQPGEPTPEGRAMRKALQFVLRDDRCDDKGYYGGKDGSRMYGHGIITLMLTELLGMTNEPELDQLVLDRCEKAIDVILSSQKEDKPPQFRGGWRYTPDSRDADLSVSVWQLMALRSARNDGLQVPSTAIDEAVEYLKRSYASPLDPDGQPDKKASGFCYEPHHTHPTFAMTAAGLLAMQVCGEYESPLVAGAADWLSEHPPKWNERFCSYGTYYYAQGMYQRGGQYSEQSQKLVQEMLFSQQEGNGAWLAQNGSERGLGRVYATSMAILTLSVKYHYLPIYQR